MGLREKLAWNEKPRDDVKSRDKDPRKDESEEQPQVIDGIRVAKASQIIRGGR